MCETVSITPGQIRNIRLKEPESFQNADRSKLQVKGFSPDLWRVCFNRGGVFSFHGLETFGINIETPSAQDSPKLKRLTYGSSITNATLDGYVHVASRMAKMDVQNKGLSGACHIEPTIVDWICDDCQWDVITCEMGINMRGGYSIEDF